MQKIILIVNLFCLTLSLQAQNVAVSGALVGNGSYPTLTAAFAALNSGAQGGATITVSILANTNEGSGTAVLNAGTWAGIQVVPVGGPRSISGATAPGQPLIDLNGADHVTFNGQLSGGVRGLTLENTTASTAAGTITVRFRNDATFNTITYANVLGASLGTGATIYFAPGQVTVGNDNNTISLCEIGPSGTNLPRTAIFSSGDPSAANSNNLVTQCNIHDYFQCGAPSTGISLGEGNLEWTISQCRFYQTETRACSLFVWHRGILINGSQGNANHTITGNTFGYANSLGTGKSVFASSSTSSNGNFYRAIDVQSLQDPSFLNVTNNVINGLDFPNIGGNDQVFSFAGIEVRGSINVTGNTIGSSTVPGTISMGSLAGNATVNGINIEITGVKTVGAIVHNNIIGGIYLDVLPAAVIDFNGIKTYGNQPTFNCNLTNNQIGFAAAPIVVNSASSSSFVKGIRMYGEDIDVFDNTVSYLFARSSAIQGLIGIDISANGFGNFLKRNRVFALEASHPTAPIQTVGIRAFGLESTNRNHVHALSALSPNAQLVGMNLTSFDPCLHSNNMVRLGRDYHGQSLRNGIAITGIFDNLGSNNFYFNSIYIGGDSVGGSASTYAYYGDVITSNLAATNNIFYNARSNGNGTGRHYASYNVTSTLPARSGNDLYVTGNGGILGYASGQDILTLPMWQAITAGDAGSICSDPHFLNPDGDAVTGDLHIGPISPIEAAGVSFVGIGDMAFDFDGQVRGSLTPADIGADAVVTQAQAPQLPEVVLTGNGLLVMDGDDSPSASDGTFWGNGPCSNTAPGTFVIQNTGAAPLIISSYGLTGPGAAQFSIVVPPPGVIQPGQSATISIVAATPSSGILGATFNFSCNDWDETYYNFSVAVAADNVAPVVVCNALTVYLGSNGLAQAPAAMLAAGSTDNCGIASISVSPSSFDCGQLGLQPVVVQVTDSVGNADTCHTSVMVIDTIPATLNCHNANLYLDASGQVSPLLSTLVTLTDNCLQTTTLTPSQFTCVDAGPQTVTVTATDGIGNVVSCQAQAMVIDTFPLLVTCHSGNLYLDASGQVSPLVSTLATITDNCLPTSTLTPSQFTCADVGSQVMTVAVQDVAGNSDSCLALLQVLDTLAPVLVCQNTSIVVGSSGNTSVALASVLAASSDNCGIDTLYLSQATVSCADVGSLPLTVSAIDIHGNSGTCTANVLVQATPLTLQLHPPALGPCGHHITCAGQANATATASPGGACAPYTYAWSNGQAGATATGLGAGTHSVTVTSADGQQQVQTITLTAPDPLAVVVTGSLSCLGGNIGSAAAVVSGGSSCQPYTYLWSNGQTTGTLTGLAPGTYPLTVTDVAGCTDTASYTVGILPASSVAITQQQATLTATPGFASYQWYNASGAIPGANGQQFTPLTDGNYYVIATDGNGCQSTSAVFPFTFVNARTASAGWADITLYPNPGQGVFRFDLVQALQGPLRVEVIDMHGRILYDARLDALDGNRVFDLSGLAAGMYLVRLIGEEQRMHFRLRRD
jgi:hypothetical protein